MPEYGRDEIVAKAVAEFTSTVGEALGIALDPLLVVILRGKRVEVSIKPGDSPVYAVKAMKPEPLPRKGRKRPKE